ncbi:MAG: PLP-dependent lyase/thiolase [Acidimicrobiia bacterium]|nr:PLP-dependent lyase/thiolase [Acidimicrobiia bacterium]
MSAAAERGSPHPFIRYRWLLDSYRKAIGRGWSDGDFVSLVTRLDEAIAGVEGHGFSVTPLSRQDRLAASLGIGSAPLWVKDETGNVGGSHKARHLFGVLLHLAIDEEDESELAIASCGNAAVAAAVVARAVERPLRVFIPTWADPAVVQRLELLGARIEVCERRPDELGDPAFLRFLDSVQLGARPFSVQSTITETTLDGGRTIGWELAEQLALARAHGTIELFVQVGGGALAASLWRGLTDGIREQWLDADPVLITVQTEATAPLNRAWRRLQAWSDDYNVGLDEADFTEATMSQAHENSDAFMQPWETVGMSAASGILDDVTYDWLPVTEAMIRSGGMPLVVNEEMILRANEIGRSSTGINVDHTGTAGLAGLLGREATSSFDPAHHVVVLFTGVQRT